MASSTQLLQEELSPCEGEVLSTASAFYCRASRVFDVAISALALIVLSPLLLLLAAIVWLDDPYGSPIFAQTRIGLNGKPFRFYKFRSMRVDAEQRLDDLLKMNEADGPVFKLRDDPRITRVGRVLRKTSMDELPQLWNVLRGDMSLVGPRPALPREVEKYTPYQRQRLSVIPGLTCYWQIQPDRHSISFSQWVELDLKYIRERSLWVDFCILVRTVGVVLHADSH